MPRSLQCAAALSMLLLAACAQMLPMPQRPANAWTAPDWQYWSLRGRIAVHAGAEGWQAGLNWRQTGESFRLELTGPLGQGAVRMQGDAEGVALERADGQRDWAPDADALLARNTGWTLPVTGLRHWIRGRAVPDRPAQWEWAADGLPRRLRQDGWIIRYTEFREQAGLGMLPRRIDLERDSQRDDDGIRARVLIDGWSGSGHGD